MKRFYVILAFLCGTGFMNSAQAESGSTFTISVDKAAWEKWGFRYPVTYIFEVSGIGGDARVSRREAGGGSWSPLKPRTSAELFNGVECVRFDKGGGKVYVSIGFGATNTIELQFSGATSAKFASVARYYDNRQAAFTLSNDNWGCNPWAHPGAVWKGPTDDESDNYQAALHVCRSFHLPVSIAINSRSAGGEAMWRLMQEELDRGDSSWEPAVHGWTHPKDAAGYKVHGYRSEILGCRDDILKRLHKVPYGQYVYEHILTTGYVDEEIMRLDAGEFLFVRGFNWLDNPTSITYVPWNREYRFYGVGGLNRKGLDRILEKSEPKGRFHAADVADLNKAFDEVVAGGGVFYALWHPDRFKNSVIYDPRPGIEGQQGSTLMQHLAHVANRKDVWYVANGWMYSYRYVAENARVVEGGK
jgi:hypothetical protein